MFFTEELRTHSTLKMYPCFTYLIRRVFSSSLWDAKSLEILKAYLMCTHPFVLYLLLFWVSSWFHDCVEKTKMAFPASGVKKSCDHPFPSQPRVLLVILPLYLFLWAYDWDTESSTSTLSPLSKKKPLRYFDGILMAQRLKLVSDRGFAVVRPVRDQSVIIVLV